MEREDLPVLWAMATLPNIGATADSSVPLPLPGASEAPEPFADLADPWRHFEAVGGCFLVATVDGHVAAMGGFRPRCDRPGRIEILRVRVHPALRRRGLGQALMSALEAHARAKGFREAWLDTATNQPEAMAFYASLGYRETGRETRTEWHWTLVYYLKELPRP
ncbi:GNAT family N-acetyltransferase [Streptomyces litchfieldiae]|uniref:GNAT family N-acetyltransferase n=1 Tax=Streptomyces litchfieldiae TaxID=3075543 RepID=A0ABU2MV66_9ACTN|nr:GNAT family N-acetyltransferase [Streptomyces sp. DSM 44938]MDT0345465.1 GNAT family N-acetyltransferase [Streptomyces sp. DSM 44938]